MCVIFQKTFLSLHTSLGIAIFARTSGSEFPGGSTWRSLIFLFVPLYVLGDVHMFGTSFDLLLNWLYILWLFYYASTYLINHEINSSNLQSGSRNFIGTKLVTLMREMDEVSGVWKLNHGIRYILLLLMATIQLASVAVGIQEYYKGQSGDPLVLTLNLDNFVLSVVLYLCVLLTALATGFLTDNFFDETGAKLFHIAQGTKQDISTRKNAGKLLLEFEALYGRFGIRFAGIALTLAGSLTVGSIVSVLVVNTTLLSVTGNSPSTV